MLDTDNITATLIVVMVANFLISTYRAHKAIKLCQEGLSLVSKPELRKQNEFYKELKMAIYVALVRAYIVMDDCTNAIKYTEKYLHIQQERGEMAEEYRISMFLAKLYFRQREYVEGRKLLEKALLISTEIGDNNREILCYGDLFYGKIYQEMGEYDKAKQHYKKGLAMAKQIGDRKAEALLCGNLGTVSKSVGQFQKAKQYHERAISISKEIGDKKQERVNYGSLGTVFQSVAEYEKAKECYEIAVSLSKEIGDKQGEATYYGNLGVASKSLGEFQKAKEYHKKALAISKEIFYKKRRGNSIRKPWTCVSISWRI